MSINYSEKFENLSTIESVRAMLENLNNDIRDNVDVLISENVLVSVLKKINDDNEKDFANTFAYALDDDRKKAFDSLIEKPYYIVYSLKINENKTYSILDGKRLFRFAKLEKVYQLKHSTDTDSANKPIPNKSKTVFGALRFYGLCSCFMRNLQKSIFEIDDTKAYKLEKVKIDGENIFTEKDGECFKSNSNNALDKQLNLIIKFFGYDVTMRKADLPILKIKAQKIKQNTENAKFSVDAIVDDKSVLKFADVIFGVIATRIKGEDIEVITKKAEKETTKNMPKAPEKATTETETK